MDVEDITGGGKGPPAANAAPPAVGAPHVRQVQIQTKYADFSSDFVAQLSSYLKIVPVPVCCKPESSEIRKKNTGTGTFLFSSIVCWLYFPCSSLY
jgi:hypothetical protein